MSNVNIYAPFMIRYMTIIIAVKLFMYNVGIYFLTSFICDNQQSYWEVRKTNIRIPITGLKNVFSARVKYNCIDNEINSLVYVCELLLVTFCDPQIMPTANPIPRSPATLRLCIEVQSMRLWTWTRDKVYSFACSHMITCESHGQFFSHSPYWPML